MRHAKLTCQEILGMFQARAVLEEEYGKKLLKLSKSPLGKDEIGSLRDSLDVVRYEIEATGKSHIELAGKMRDQLESALAEFNNSQKDKRKMAKEKFDAECLRSKGLSAAKMNLVGKELDKVSMKMEKTELASRAADVEYQASVRQLTEINDKWIVEWRGACDKFQLLEEQRIDYLRTTLWNYANIISSTCVADDESCERIRSSLELCDVNQNLQNFVDTCATGEEAPDMQVYLNSKNSDSIEASSPTAPRAQPQETRTRTVCGPHQPIPSNDGSAPSSRRQSVYSTDCKSDTDGVPSAPMEMALQVGGNVFKLDSQTTALLNQVDDSVQPIVGESAAGTSNTDRSLTTNVEAPQSVGENSLGISLDARGTVKENRFPHWQPQASLQQHPVPGYPAGGPVHRAGYSPQHGSMDVSYPHSNPGSIPVTHTRSQVMPTQNESVTPIYHGTGPGSHMTTPSGPYMVAPGVNSFHEPYRGVADPPATQHMQPASNMAHDGRPILFYVRAIYDYEATIPEELSLKEGDIIGVLHARDDGWWEGNLLDDYRGPIRGLFPSNFTEPTA
ncbi:Proline-serine-threonine phosphatase-interacting protein 2 [Mortierella sp. GBA43]|nr:Proline-serine-threonine phosphatase-interacting protein 2 [Mortierella sp. GBA43]